MTPPGVRNEALSEFRAYARLRSSRYARAEHALTTADLPRAAFGLAKRGLAVFELIPGDKRPLRSGGYKTASNNPEVTRARWVKEPSANIGIATGQANGFWVLDVDAQHGGFESLAELEALHGALPLTITVSTPNGGDHRYFHWQDGLDLRNSVSRIGPGLDVRAEGGSITAPPSCLVDGRRYRWIRNGAHAFVDAPDWLVKLALPPPQPPRSELKPLDGDVSKYVGAAVANELRILEQATEGCRNQILFRVAATLAGFVAVGALPEDWARDRLERVAIGIGLDPVETTQTIDSGIRAGSHQPRNIPT